MGKNAKSKVSPIFFCYSPTLSRFLQREGLQVVGEGLNKNTGKPFWQFVRGEELDRLLDEWKANNPNRK